MEQRFPELGEIVIYQLRTSETNSINGNKTVLLPAIVVAVWSPTCVNLKVITDGHNDLWVTSALQGTEPGKWNFKSKQP